VSAVLAPAQALMPDRATALVTLAAGVALAEGVERATGLSPEIKWPNDLLAGRRKLCGILAEGVSLPGVPDADAAESMRVVLGFGINVAVTAFPPDLADRVTSLETELGRPIDRAELCAHVLGALARRYDDLLAGRFDAILGDWRDRAPGSRGRRVRWDEFDGPRTGITAGIDDRGALLVQSEGRIERIVAGDVIWE
jgi:BirA family biotin operon repressor/biotin-[acetyl-CoA-carboxylase] ligase